MWSLVALLFFVRCARTQQCSQLSGPPGTTSCIKLPAYNNQYQWATCLTNSYIKQRSGHKHACVYPGAIYCWYQCMLEVYSRNFGPVTSVCSCTPGRTFTPSLPAACYSPSGESCGWYRNCLERKYPCQDTSNAYAIQYAEKFCRLYDERRALLSPDGQKWVDATRRCLQVNLVPLVRPLITATCSQIRQWALASHSPCYLSPDQNVSSICDLKCTDYFKIFWSIKGSFSKLDTAWGSIKGLWNIESKCDLNSHIRQCFQGGAAGITNVTKITVQKFKQVSSTERPSVSLSADDAESRFADGVGSSIVRTLKWNTFVMDWVAYPSGRFGGSDDVDIIIVLADSKALGIVTTSAPSTNFNHTIHEFASAIEEGKLPLQVDGYNVWVKSLALCSDKSCTRTQTLAVSDKPPKWNGATKVSCANVGLFGVIAALLVYRPFL